MISINLNWLTAAILPSHICNRSMHESPHFWRSLMDKKNSFHYMWMFINYKEKCIKIYGEDIANVFVKVCKVA